MLSVTLTRPPVSTLTPAPAVPALSRSPNFNTFMPIDQAKLNAETRAAIHSFCALLPTTIGSMSEAVRDEGLAFTITNPVFPDRPIEVFTDNEE